MLSTASLDALVAALLEDVSSAALLDVLSSAALLDDAALEAAAELAADVEVLVDEDPQPANRVATIAALTRDATTFCFIS